MDGKETLVTPSAPQLVKDCSTSGIGLIASLNQRFGGKAKRDVRSAFGCVCVNLNVFNPRHRVYTPALVSAPLRQVLDGDDGRAKSH